MDNRKNLKRRYFLSTAKKSRRKHKMENNGKELEDVATDSKLKQFLADVEKYSERSKLQNDESKQHREGKHHVVKEKRGLFENGMLSKPSVKGVLGLKNKARKVGNLENLLKENATEGEYTPSIESTTDSPFDRRNYDEKIMEEQQNNGQTLNEIRTSTSRYADKNELKDNVLDFANKNASEYKEEICDTCEKKRLIVRATIFDAKEELLSELEKWHMIRMLRNDPADYVSDVKTVFNEFVRAYIPKMVDEYIQTEDSFFASAPEANKIAMNLFAEGNPFTPKIQEAHSDLHVLTTGQEQEFNHCYKNTSASKCSNFLEILDEPSKIKAEQFSSVSKKASNPLHFLSPQKLENPPLFELATPELPPPRVDGMCWAPVIKKIGKPHFPSILTPPSPGRKYLKYPAFFEDSQWNRTQNIHFPNNLKENFSNFVSPEPSSSQQFTIPSRSSNISFPKRPKVIFSPHRL